MNREDIRQKRNEKKLSILEAATAVFAEQGFAGARTDEIAERAGISKRSMYYHVGDKKTLYDIVINESVEKSMQNTLFKLDSKQSPEENMKEFIQRLAHSIDKFPKLHAIILRENLSGGINFSEDAGKSSDKHLDLLFDILEQGKDQGVFNETNPLIIFAMIFGLFLFWKINTPLTAKSSVARKLSEQLGEDVSGKLVEEVQKLILRIPKSKNN